VEAPQFSFDRLVTNDVVDINDYIHFKWLGRYDNVINSGGVKFFPEQLEKLLEGKLPKPFYISAINDKKWGEAVGITLLEGSADEKSVISICKEVLPPYAVPKHVRFVEKMDYTRTGKLRRNMQE
jgi:O-succinylbenzoic acid--CoA ligase